MRILVGVLICSAGALAQQVERGDTLYQQQCAGCHALKGKGTAVGPDLNGMARLTSQAIAMAVRSTATQYVQSVKLKAGDTIVGMPGPKDDKTVSFWDLGKKPPELRKMDKGDVAASTNTDAWKHPPAEAKIEAEQLADIVAYIKYTATGSKRAVSPDEVK